MTTTTLPPPATSALRRRPFFIGASLLMALIAVVGFWPTYFGPLVTGRIAQPLLIHVHATVFTGWLVLFLVLIVGAKVVPTYVIARLADIGSRPLQLATGLGQIGEFSFVLAAVLAAAGAIDAQIYVGLIAAVAISIGASTIAVRFVPRSPHGVAAAA